MEGTVSKEKKEKIILDVKYRELLWNKEDVNYKNVELKKAMWKLIGEDVHLSGNYFLCIVFHFCVYLELSLTQFLHIDIGISVNTNTFRWYIDILHELANNTCSHDL